MTIGTGIAIAIDRASNQTQARILTEYEQTLGGNMPKVGQVWITETGNCWAIERVLDENRAMVRRVAIRSANGELYAPPRQDDVYCWYVNPMPGRLLTGNVDNLAGWILTV